MTDLDRAVANAMGLKSVNNCEKWGTRMTEEDEAFNDIERQAKQRKEAVKVAITPKVVELEMYDIGWNSALEMAALKIEKLKGFGTDTLSGLAIYIREMKK